MAETKLLELPFQDAQRLFNRLYYQRGGRYERDFQTAASSSPALPFAEAEDFHRHLSHFSSLPGEIRILELGPGDGNSAARFLNRLAALDRENGSSFYARTEYILADFSPQMLASAQSNSLLKRHAKRLSFTVCDAERIHLREKDLLLVRANELLDDLPTGILTRDGARFFEVTVALHLDQRVKISRLDGPQVSHAEFARLALHNSRELSLIDGSFLRHVSLQVAHRPTHPDIASAVFIMDEFRDFPENSLIPIPFAASSAILSLKPLLMDNGRIDFFDYGFSSLAELDGLQDAVFRTPGTLTVFVNFPYLARAARLAGFRNIIIEPQSKFAPKARKLEHGYHLRIEK